MGSAVQFSKDDKNILFFVALVWGVDMLYYLKAVVMRIPVINAIADIFVPSAVIISLIVTFQSLYKQFHTSDYLSFGGCLIVYIMTYIFFPENYKYLTKFNFLSDTPILFYRASNRTSETIKSY